MTDGAHDDGITIREIAPKVGKMDVSEVLDAILGLSPPERATLTTSLKRLESDDLLRQKSGGLGRGMSSISPRSARVESSQKEEQVATSAPDLKEKFWSRAVGKYGDPERFDPQVQFSSPLFYVTEGEGIAVITVIRIGHLDVASEVSFKTIDGSAVAGKKYIRKEGTLKFELNDHKKDLQITLIENESFDATLEFAVELSQPVGAKLAHYNTKCNVRIIDDDRFPSNNSSDKVLAAESDYDRFKLFYEYVKMNLGNPIVRKGTIRMCLVDFLENLYFMLNLFLKLWLVDVVFNDDDSDWTKDRSRGQLLIAVFLIIVPFPFIHVLNYWKNYWRVGGASRKVLLENLMRKFLNYNEESRAKLSDAEVFMALTRDAPRVVVDGFLNLPPLIKSLFRLLLLLLYQVALPSLLEVFDMDVPPRPLAMIPLFTFPVLMGLFLHFRLPGFVKVLTKEMVSLEDLIVNAQETVLYYPTIVDYHHRSGVMAGHEKKVSVWNADLVAKGAYNTNSLYFAPWLTLIAVAMYTFFGGVGVVDNLGGTSDIMTSTTGAPTEEKGLTLGEFLATLDVFRAIGDSWGSIYNLVLEIQATAPELKRIAMLMNLPTEVETRKSIKERQDEQTEKLVSATLESTALDSHMRRFAMDLLPIGLRDVEFRHKGYGRITGALKTTTWFQQGGLYMVLGSSKSTLLRILGGVIIAEMKGEICIPTHLQVLHISDKPVFFALSLYDNLIYGVRGDDDDKEERVLNICQRLGLPDMILDAIKDRSPHPWRLILSETHQALLSLARALIANPEVLLLHKPALFLSLPQRLKVFSLLRNYVDQRGLEKEESEFWFRRPRTCIMSSTNPAGYEVADAVFDVEGRADEDDVVTTTGTKSEVSIEHHV